MIDTAQPDPFEKRALEDGEMLYSEGDSAEECFVVRSGAIELMERDDDGFFQTVREIGVGQILGEGALVSDVPRKYSARAKGDVVCVVISRTQMEEKLQSADAFIRGMFRVVLGNFAAIRNIDSESPVVSDPEQTLRDLQIDEEAPDEPNDPEASDGPTTT